jgi:hypothetical protein
VEPSDGKEAERVEQSVAWMFGLTPSPVLTEPVVPEQAAAEPVVDSEDADEPSNTEA